MSADPPAFYPNVASELREKADKARQELLGLLEDRSRDHAEMQRILRRLIEYEATADALAEPATSPAPPPTAEGDPSARVRSPAAGEPNVPADGGEDQGDSISVRPSPPSARPALHLDIRPEAGEPYSIALSGAAERYVIGRMTDAPAPDVDVAIGGDSISERHCEIVWKDAEGWMIRDLDSTNGTILDGGWVEQPTALPDLAHVELGETKITVTTASRVA